MAVSVLRRTGSPHPAALCAGAQITRAIMRHPSRSPEPTCTAARIRQPSSAQWRRSAGGTDAAWALGYFDDTNLHSRAGRTAEVTGARLAPVGRDWPKT